MTNAPKARSNYTPGVRPRSARQDGQRRYTPGYLEDLSDTKTWFFSDPGRVGTRQTVLTPSKGRRLRLIRLTAHQIRQDGAHFCELYFGTGANIAVNPEKAVGYVRVPDLGEGATRTWSRGSGPAGAKNEVLSIRWTTTPTSQHKLIIEYTEER